MAVVRRIACVVHGVVDHGDHVYTVKLQPSIPVPAFKPGQFLHLALDPYDAEGFWPDSRVFSIASSPQQRDRLEITYAVKGSFTTRMERELVVGGQAWVKLPYGEFVIDPNRDTVLFAGGTGVTAFTAFLEGLTPAHEAHVALFYGARSRALFVYGPQVEARALDIPSLTYRFVCEETDGRLSVSAAWPMIASLTDPLIYLSGPPSMLTSLTAQLRDRGVPDERIRIDAWE